ncbi:aldehyde dehydrogenase family protein, partial [Micromonospora sp. NPDC049559]|uniref:aldehyde dehydrogenase family protein n=1 Tax=Micromonospora sp. NPDC049559 TaxID=3155923 RepID=UPI0034222B14
KLTVGPDNADIGPITMPAQIDTIRRHIDDALAHGAHAPLGGPDAIQPPYVHPTILTNVPPDAAAVQEETFGPTLTITRVATTDEAITHANNTRYGLGAAVFAKRNATTIARQLRTGMVAINSVLSFTAVAGLPYGGVGDSGFGRTHGDDGLREFSRSQSIARRRGRSPLPTMTFERTPAQVARIARMIRRIYGR